jgi:hypothetical protein
VEQLFGTTLTVDGFTLVLSPIAPVGGEKEAA